MKMILPLAFAAAVLFSSAYGLGEPVKVENLGEAEHEIINFAFSQLTGGDTCKREIVKVVDFYKQMVAGQQYIFHLQLAPKNEDGCGDAKEETCKMVVWDRPWEKYREVQWHNVTCTRHGEEIEDETEFEDSSEDTVTSTTDNPSGLLRVSLSMSQQMGTVSNAVRKVLRLKDSLKKMAVGMKESVLGGGDHDYLPHGTVPKKNMGGDDHDYVPHGKPLKKTLGGDDHDYIPHGKPLTKNIGGDDHDYVPHGKPLTKNIGGDDHDYVPHGKPLTKNIGGDDHDYVPHGTPLTKNIGGDDHDYIPHETPLTKNIGGDDHDYIPHGTPLTKNIGGDDHDYVPHGTPLTKNLGGDDHDYVPHGTPLKKSLGGDDHDYLPHVKKQVLLGGGDHDYVSHGLVGAGTPHGPRFSGDDSLPFLKKLKTDQESAKELSAMQSLMNFHSFMEKHNKTYAHKMEYKKRYQIFRQNMKKVQFLQQTEQGSGVYGATHLADLTEEEFRTRYLGLRKTGDGPDVHWPAADIPEVELPAEFDWRTKNAVTPVKNQGQCGSCWAFSVTGNVEGLYAIRNNKLVSLSEQELVDCDTRDNGCNGGLPENAYKTLLEIGGLETETDYGYDGEDEKCKFNRSRVVARVKGGLEISQNETQMAQWLLQNGPISVGLNANAMQFYMGGVSHPFKFLCNPEGIDHGVLIVGFGIKEYPLFHRTMPYWIIKNSWGTGWGEQGYYRLYRGDGTCGINMMTSSAVLDD